MTRLLDLLNHVSRDDPGIVIEVMAAGVVIVLLLIAHASGLGNQ